LLRPIVGGEPAVCAAHAGQHLRLQLWLVRQFGLHLRRAGVEHRADGWFSLPSANRVRIGAAQNAHEELADLDCLGGFAPGVVPFGRQAARVHRRQSRHEQDDCSGGDDADGVPPDETDGAIAERRRPCADGFVP